MEMGMGRDSNRDGVENGDRVEGRDEGGDGMGTRMWMGIRMGKR